MTSFLPNGYAKIIPTWTLAGSTKVFQTVFMIQNGADDVASAINASWRTAFCNTGRPFVAGNMYVGYTLAKTEVYRMLGGVLTYDLNETPIVGSKASSLGSPINTSILIKKNTLVIGRRFQGRHMMPNLNTAEAGISQAGIIDPTEVAALKSLWDPAMATLNGLTGYQTVLGHSVSEVAPTPYETVTIQQKIGTMRRRIRGF